MPDSVTAKRQRNTLSLSLSLCVCVCVCVHACVRACVCVLDIFCTVQDYAQSQDGVGIAKMHTSFGIMQRCHPNLEIV